MAWYKVKVEGKIFEPEYESAQYTIEADDAATAREIAEDKFIDCFEDCNTEVEIDYVEPQEIAPPIIEEPVAEGQVSLFEEENESENT